MTRYEWVETTDGQSLAKHIEELDIDGWELVQTHVAANEYGFSYSALLKKPQFSERDL